MSTAGCIRCHDDASDVVALDDRMMHLTQRSKHQRGEEQHPPARRLTHSAWLEHCSLPVLTPGSRCATSRRQHPMPTREPRCGTTGPAAAWTGTPPTSSPLTSQAPHGNRRTGREMLRLAGSRRPELAADANHPCGDAQRPQRERDPPFGSPVVPRRSSAEDAQIRSIWRRSDAVWAVRPYRDKVRAS